MLCSKNGFFAGSHLIMNTGRMTHANLTSEMRGMSKALNMSLHLLVCPEKLPVQMAYNKAWTPLNILNIKRRYLPIIHVVARKLDSLFWVSNILFLQLWNNYPEGRLLFHLRCLL